MFIKVEHQRSALTKSYIDKKKSLKIIENYKMINELKIIINSNCDRSKTIYLK